MTRTIEINPVTRIEGHAKITLQLNSEGRVRGAQFHVTQFRGFEKFIEGRPFYEMPAVMARICGICPVSHLLASAKACDDIQAVRIPPAAERLRRILNLSQWVQSHALSFFHLSSPDLLLGMDAPVEDRNIFGVMKTYPELARDGIRLRKFGQRAIDLLAGKRIHPSWAAPGGVTRPLTEETRDEILKDLPEAMRIAQETLEYFKQIFSRFEEETRTFANFPSLFLGLVNKNNELEHYDGNLRWVDASGAVVKEGVAASDYAEYIGESVQHDSYLKSPFFKPMGFPDGMYRVGPLARLNVIDRCGTPLADQEWAEFRSMSRGAVLSSFHYHFARLIEIIYSLEMIEKLLLDPITIEPHVLSQAGVNSLEGMGMTEAPRGMLLHHYKVDKNGLMQDANLIIATGHNNLALNRGVLQVAKHFVDETKLKEGMLNRVEAVVRAFDPCLSCSTHAVGQMPLRIELVDAEGVLLDSVQRGG